MIIRWCAYLALLALALAGGPVRAAAEPFDLYVILSLTGPGAFIGRGESQGLAAAERYVNNTGGIKGRPIRFVVADDQSNPSVAVQLASGLFSKGIPALLGPGFGPICTALVPMVSTGPVMYCFANNIHPASRSFAFSGNPSTKDFTAAAFRYLKAKGVRKLAVLSSTDASGQDGERVAVENLHEPEFSDLTLVANEHMALADLSVTAQLTRIKAAGAEAVDAWTAGTAFATVLRAVQESGFNGIVMTNGGNINKAQMESYAAFLPRDLIFTASPTMAQGAIPPRVRLARATFNDLMNQLGIVAPDATQSASWDPALILVEAFRHLGTNATAPQIREYIDGLHDFAGIMGFYDFRRGDQRGLDPLSSPIVRWDKAGDNFVTISRPGGLPL